MKKILVKIDDGSVAIIIPAANDIHGVMPDKQQLDRDARAVPGYVSHEEIDDSQIPSDRTFRSAWSHDLSINVDKAKEIHKNKLRELRQPKLDHLDIEYQKADEQGDLDKKKEIANKKQALRDVTKIELSNDVSILKDQIPDILK